MCDKPHACSCYCIGAGSDLLFLCSRLCQVNVLGVCVFTREFMTQLKERGEDEGHIININGYCRII